jgi:hypothetical protein
MIDRLDEPEPLDEPEHDAADEPDDQRVEAADADDDQAGREVQAKRA